MCFFSLCTSMPFPCVPLCLFPVYLYASYWLFSLEWSESQLKKKKTFIFHRDDSTTSQIKKLFDGYVKFFSLELGEVVIAYCETLFIGRCSALDMVSHLKMFVAKQNPDLKLLLNLGMGGPNVNVSSQNLLMKEWKEKYYTPFIDLGTCSLHSANNGFGKLVKELDDIFELDQVGNDFHWNRKSLWNVFRKSDVHYTIWNSLILRRWVY